MDKIQEELFSKASSFLNEHTNQVDSIDQMNQVLNTKGGFIEAFWNGDSK